MPSIIISALVGNQKFSDTQPNAMIKDDSANTYYSPIRVFNGSEEELKAKVFALVNELFDNYGNASSKASVIELSKDIALKKQAETEDKVAEVKST